MRGFFRCLKGLGLRCPNCGVGPLTRNFLGSVELCSGCGYRFLGQTGDFWGGVVLTYTLAGTAAITASAFLIAHEVASTVAVTFISVGIVIVTALLTFPFCKAVWIHLVFQGRGHYEEYRPPR